MPAPSGPPCSRPFREPSTPRRTRHRPACNRQQPTSSRSTACSSPALQITYALDLWGGNRRQIESLEALAEAQCFQLEGTYLSLASNVVAAAIVEASLRGQVEATRRIVATQRETLGILIRQSGLGAIPGADVATQQAALAQAESTLPPLEKALAQQRNLLATLTGRLPSDPVAERFELTDLKLPHELPLTLPSQLVEQRPDIRAAEANLHAASAQVGVAIANQLPQVTLGFGLNSSALSLGTLFMPGLAGATTGASAIQTLIDGGALAAKKRSAVAALEQADAQYQSIVLAAFRNVADTLNALEYDALALKAAVEAERAAATALTIARKRLELGDTTYVVVLIAELTYQQTLLTRVQAQAARPHQHRGALPGAGRRLVEPRRHRSGERPVALQAAGLSLVHLLEHPALTRRTLSHVTHERPKPNAPRARVEDKCAAAVGGPRPRCVPPLSARQSPEHDLPRGP
jgi:NodT family efflux transporter outer membrane factor (OMF) lipoprotein